MYYKMLGTCILHVSDSEMTLCETPGDASPSTPCPPLGYWSIGSFASGSSPRATRCWMCRFLCPTNSWVAPSVGGSPLYSHVSHVSNQLPPWPCPTVSNRGSQQLQEHPFLWPQTALHPSHEVVDMGTDLLGLMPPPYGNLPLELAMLGQWPFSESVKIHLFTQDFWQSS